MEQSENPVTPCFHHSYCVTLHKLFSLVPQFPHVRNGDSNDNYLICLCDKIINIKSNSNPLLLPLMVYN